MKKNLSFGMVAFFPVMLIALTESMAGGSAGFFFNVLVNNPLSLLPPLLLTAPLFFSLVFLTRRAWCAALIVSPPFLAAALVNFFRLQHTHTPLTIYDFFFAGQTKELVAVTDGLRFSAHIPVVLGIFAAYAAALRMLRGPAAVTRAARFSVSALLFAWAALFALPAVNAPVLAACMAEARTLSLSYQTNGFIACFMREMSNAPEMGADLSSREYVFSAPAAVLRPDGPDSNDNLKNGDMDEAPPERQPEPRTEPDGIGDIPLPEPAPEPIPPDIIFILSETFWDVKLLENCDFSDNPIKHFERIARESISGYMVSPQFGGRTDQPEFEILTGATADALTSEAAIPLHLIADGTPSVASYLKSLGYNTVGLHTYNDYFYKRSEAYPKLGFDAYMDIGDIPFPYTLNYGYVPDKVISDWIGLILEDADANDAGPTFIMAVTMENHGPQLYRGSTGEVTMTPKPGVTLSDDINTVISTFTATLYKADQMLADLTDYLRARERPAVVLFFGDHLPWMDEYYRTYVEGGFLDSTRESQWSDADFLKMHATPFLIWSNQGNTEQSVGYVSPYFLAGMTLETAHVPLNEYYEFLRDYRQILPVARRFIRADSRGAPIARGALTDEQAEWMAAHLAYSRSLLY